MYLEGKVKQRRVYYLSSYHSWHRLPQTSCRMVRVVVVNCQLIVVGARATLVWCASQEICQLIVAGARASLVWCESRVQAQHWAEHG